MTIDDPCVDETTEAITPTVNVGYMKPHGGTPKWQAGSLPLL